MNNNSNLLKRVNDNFSIIERYYFIQRCKEIVYKSDSTSPIYTYRNENGNETLTDEYKKSYKADSDAYDTIARAVWLDYTLEKKIVICDQKHFTKIMNALSTHTIKVERTYKEWVSDRIGGADVMFLINKGMNRLVSGMVYGYDTNEISNTNITIEDLVIQLKDTDLLIVIYKDNNRIQYKAVQIEMNLSFIPLID